MLKACKYCYHAKVFDKKDGSYHVRVRCVKDNFGGKSHTLKTINKNSKAAANASAKCTDYEDMRNETY